jgi:RNA-directed DNA polymerase
VSEEGTPQGGSASPLLANVYLHYVYDLWAEAWHRKITRGDILMVRFADDIVVGFQEKAEAERFWNELKERMKKFDLELHPEKTRLLEVGRYAAERRRRRGEGKPETFNFLGFTHICGKSRKGRFLVIRQTSESACRRSLRRSESNYGGACMNL